MKYCNTQTANYPICILSLFIVKNKNMSKMSVAVLLSS